MHVGTIDFRSHGDPAGRIFVETARFRRRSSRDVASGALSIPWPTTSPRARVSKRAIIILPRIVGHRRERVTDLFVRLTAESVKLPSCREETNAPTAERACTRASSSSSSSPVRERRRRLSRPLLDSSILARLLILRSRKFFRLSADRGLCNFAVRSGPLRGFPYYHRSARDPFSRARLRAQQQVDATDRHRSFLPASGCLI